MNKKLRRAMTYHRLGALLRAEASRAGTAMGANLGFGFSLALILDIKEKKRPLFHFLFAPLISSL
jgi:hypothetical protein